MKKRAPRSPHPAWRPRITNRFAQTTARSVRSVAHSLRLPVSRTEILSRDHEALADHVRATVSRHPHVVAVSAQARGKMGASWKLSLRIEADERIEGEDDAVQLINQVLECAWHIGGTSFGSYSVDVMVGKALYNALNAGYSSEQVHPQDLREAWGEA